MKRYDEVKEEIYNAHSTGIAYWKLFEIVDDYYGRSIIIAPERDSLYSYIDKLNIDAGRMDAIEKELHYMVDNNYPYVSLMYYCRYYHKAFNLSDSQLEELYDYVDSIW